MDTGKYTYSQWIMILMPIYLIAFEFFSFQYFIELLGTHLGYLLAFAFYWFGWCILLPVFVLGGIKPVLQLFKDVDPKFGNKPALTIILLFWAIPFVLVFRFLPNIPNLTFSFFAVSLIIGIFMGVSEEILWRGVYVKIFKDNIFLSYIFPSIAFALWYVAPLSIARDNNPGSIISFLIFALLLGLSFGYYTLKTGSIKWGVIAHCLIDILGFGAVVYLFWLK